MLKLIRRFASGRGGNFGMMTAILILPFMAAAGLAVDYSNASDVRAQLQNAADAAAVGAVSENSAAVAAAVKMSEDGPIASAANGATAFFRSNLTNPTRGYLTDVESSVVKNGTEIDSELTFTAEVPTRFMRIFGRDTIRIAGTATAKTHTVTFMDFYLLLDNTPSMGVGATEADVDKMVANTSDKCAFACHETDAGFAGNDYYSLAKKLGVTMRIDVVRQATANLMNTAQDPAIRRETDQFRVAIYTFGATADTADLTEITPLTDDLGEAQEKAAAIDLMTIPHQGYDNDQMTSLDNALTKIGDKIGTPGNGMSSTLPQKWVFLVSDGVGDSAKPATECTEKTTGGRCQEPIDIRYCQKLKDRGINIAVLYTTYLPLPDNPWYMTWISPFQDQIGPRMQACATPGYYFEVSPTEGISDAMDKLFRKIVLTPRIVS